MGFNINYIDFNNRILYNLKKARTAKKAPVTFAKTS